MEGIRAEIEADGGEAIRQQRAVEEYAYNLAKAASKKAAIEQQALAETLEWSKGDGKGEGKHVPRQCNPRWEPFAKSPNETASVSAILALAAKANAVEPG